jgi:LmbE family N-acetylglucosaminyl deacetylase
MSRALTTTILLFAGLLSAAAPTHAARNAAQPARTALATLDPTADTRLLVIAPHPDDEVLGAGGLMQRVRAANGVVRVVYLTDGESYTESVKISQHTATPKPSDYRHYGQRRQREARDAMGRLGISSEALIFLGFPNGGLGRLMTKYWSERRAAYRSVFTRLDRPNVSNILLPHTQYRGEDLTQELTAILEGFKPTIVLVPRKEDQHVDHCAAWFFVGDALREVRRAQPGFQTDLLTYIVHFYSWPFEDEASSLKPPHALSAGPSGWLWSPLTRGQLRSKHEALGRYKSQMAVMDWFLDGFARTNEVFSRPVPPRVVLPVRRSICEEFADRRHN